MENREDMVVPVEVYFAKPKYAPGIEAYVKNARWALERYKELSNKDHLPPPLLHLKERSRACDTFIRFGSTFVSRASRPLLESFARFYMRHLEEIACDQSDVFGVFHDHTQALKNMDDAYYHCNRLMEDLLENHFKDHLESK